MLIALDEHAYIEPRRACLLEDSPDIRFAGVCAAAHEPAAVDRWLLRWPRRWAEPGYGNTRLSPPAHCIELGNSGTRNCARRRMLIQSYEHATRMTCGT